MKSQRSQLITLVVLIIIWAISWRIVRTPTPPPSVMKTTAAKAPVQDSPLKTRFHKIRAEMDGLYHYRIKPTPFDASGNPFRISAAMAISESSHESSGTLKDVSKPTATPAEAVQPQAAPEGGEVLLKHAIEVTRIGGVVTMNDATQLTIDGQLHKEGDLFTARVHSRLVGIRIKRLTTTSVTLALDDPDAGTAEMRIRLK